MRPLERYGREILSFSNGRVARLREATALDLHTPIPYIIIIIIIIIIEVLSSTSSLSALV